jgi:hypothetical protein
MKASRDLFIGGREAGVNASRGQEQAAHFLNELRFRIRCAERGDGRQLEFPVNDN